MSNTTFDRAAIKTRAQDTLRAYRGTCIAICVVYLAVTALLAGATLGVLQLIVGTVLSVSLAGLFLSLWRGGQPTVVELFTSAFDAGFLRKLGGMLWMGLFTFLWTLLLYVPGIIKAISYSMTPYILADCPNVTAKDALKLSMRMTRGHKGDLFVAALSFFGWMLLSGLTLGILLVVYVQPYMQLTFAGIYDELKQIALEEGTISQSELDGETPAA